MPKYRYTDPETKRTWVSDSKLSPDELDEAFGASMPPLSQNSPTPDPRDPVSQIQGVDLKGGAATALRVGAPIATGVGVGLLTENPLIGRAAAGVASAGATYLANKIEGKPTSPLEVAEQGVVGAAYPSTGGLASRTVGPFLAGGAYGWGSVTLDSIAKGEGIPAWGTQALGFLFGGTVFKGADKIVARQSLREVLPTDVADEAHSVITQGKLTETGISSAEREDLSNIKSTLGNIRKAKGKFQPKPATTTSQSGRPPEEPNITFGSPQAGPKYQDPKRLTSILYKAAPPMRLFDRLQKQTGVPVYDDVYRPIHDNIHDFDALEKEVKRIKTTYLDDPAVPEQVKRIVKNYTRIATHVNDETYQNLVDSIKSFKRNLPIFNKEIDDQTAHRWANTIISAPQLSLLGFRIGTPARVLSHILQTGYTQLGERGLAVGVKGALSRQGWREAIADGVLEDRAAPEEIEAVEAEAKSWLGRAAHWGYSGIRGAADLSRVTVYQGQKHLTTRAAQKAAGNVEKFIGYAHLRIGLPEAEMNNIVNLYKQGNIGEAIRTSGIARANSSVPLHSRADRMMAATGGTGSRLAFGLSTWPAFYGNLLKDIATGPATKGEKALAAARWIGANAILFRIAKGVYEASGDDPDKAAARAGGFTYFTPMFYGLGPAVTDVFQGTVGAGKELASGRNIYGKEVKTSTAISHLGRAVKPAIPYSYAAVNATTGLYHMLKKTTEDRQ